VVAASAGAPSTTGAASAESLVGASLGEGETVPLFVAGDEVVSFDVVLVLVLGAEGLDGAWRCFVVGVLRAERVVEDRVVLVDGRFVAPGLLVVGAVVVGLVAAGPVGAGLVVPELAGVGVAGAVVVAAGVAVAVAVGVGVAAFCWSSQVW
jgi:hypothetical protein